MLKRLAQIWVRSFHSSLRMLVATLGTVGLGVYLVVLVAIAKLSNDVLEQEAFAFDTTTLLWIHQFANPILDAVMLTMTHLGNPVIVVPVSVGSFAWLWWQRHRAEAYVFGLNCIGGAVLGIGLKLVFSKVRPQLWPQLINETTFSYPSGHALGSMILYGFLAYVLATLYPRFSAAFYSLASLLISAIGFSRLYLGVHWPTDIMGGYGIGFLWLSICVTLLKLQKLRSPQVRMPAAERFRSDDFAEPN
ncbi:MAG: phosphatase PAP2 family protein [Cyanobacteria bacterium P01_A01_bin.17]